MDGWRELVKKATLKNLTRADCLRFPLKMQITLISFYIAIAEALSNPNNTYPPPPVPDFELIIACVKCEHEGVEGLEIDVEGRYEGKTRSMGIGPLDPLTWEPLIGEGWGE